MRRLQPIPSPRFLHDTVTNFKTDIKDIAQSFLDFSDHVRDTIDPAHGTATADALGSTTTNSALGGQHSMTDVKSGFEAWNDTASGTHNIWANSANGMLNASGANDAFVFKPNFGQGTSGISNLANNSVSADHALPAELQHLVDA